ncbi:penicillin-binding protein PBP2A [Streptococcus sp. S784/96/1]|uniref:penicillin-binding protein PBP2A n=1 Tax=Streptococcus sp. S784/96/1 TaxID=2653499 RepID=UPI0013866657|nr:penicillin-binding protein PBP2A [Streptococcus sp. S784/96/1]
MTFLELLKKKFFPTQYRKEQQEFVDNISSDESDLCVTVEEKRVDVSKQEEYISRYQRSRNHHQKEEKRPEILKKADKLKLNPKNPLRQFWRRYHLGKLVLIVTTGCVLLVSGYLFYLAKTAKVSDLQEALKATTVIYDRNDEYAGSLTGQKGTYVELDAISDDLEHAVIATEDRTFYENKGINFKRTILAVLTLGKSGGGSTITQQLAKNAYLTQDQTIKRKAREFFLALELTKKYKKEDILTMYLNNAYFGNGIWGVEDASQKYFGTSAANLALDEAATLAGMLKGPEIYNPYYSIENATNRRDTVLQGMVEAGYISQESANEATTIGMGNRLADTYSGKMNDYKYPSYFDAVISEAIDTYGLSEKDILNNGYKIYTELDQNYQTGMQNTLDDDNFIYVAADGEPSQAASVALDPKTGGVRGLVGRSNSTENTHFRSFNYATQGRRSPASAIKPLLVYAPAIASGWSIDEPLPNTKRDFNGYAPSNYGGIETEDLPMYQALANSYNIPAVYTLDQIGVSKSLSYGKKLGLKMEGVPEELGIALGSSVTVSPLEMAQAYATFANEGVMNKAHLITRIETASGDKVKAYTPSAKRVFSKTVADKMTSMMLGTFTNGTATAANVYGYTMAGKTGTNEASFNPDVISDQWVIGYTPDVVISQWIGYDQTDEGHYIVDPYSNASALFSTVASTVLPYTPGTDFTAKNAYVANGIEAVYDVAAQENQDESRSIIDDLRDSAAKAKEDLEKALQDTSLQENAENIWNSIVDYFR